MSVKVQDAVWEFSRASGTLLTILLALADWADDEGYCHPSFRQLAKKGRCTRRSVIRGVQQLVQWGELERSTERHHETANRGRLAYLRGQRTNSYRITLVDQVVSPRSPLRDKVVSPVSPPRRSQVVSHDHQQNPQVVTFAPPEVVTSTVASISVSTNPSVKTKSSDAGAPRDFHNPVENSATYKQLERLVHQMLDDNPFETIADLSESVKTAGAQLRVTVDPQLLARAISSVLVTRGYDRRNSRRTQ